jgi:hypothetical protein
MQVNCIQNVPKIIYSSGTPSFYFLNTSHIDFVYNSKARVIKQYVSISYNPVHIVEQCQDKYAQKYIYSTTHETCISLAHFVVHTNTSTNTTFEYRIVVQIEFHHIKQRTNFISRIVYYFDELNSISSARYMFCN